MENPKWVRLDPIIFSRVMLLWCVSTRLDSETDICSACEPGIWLLSDDFLEPAEARDLVVRSFPGSWLNLVEDWSLSRPAKRPEGGHTRSSPAPPLPTTRHPHLHQKLEVVNDHCSRPCKEAPRTGRTPVSCHSGGKRLVVIDQLLSIEQMDLPSTKRICLCDSRPRLGQFFIWTPSVA